MSSLALILAFGDGTLGSTPSAEMESFPLHGWPQTLLETGVTVNLACFAQELALVFLSRWLELGQNPMVNEA